MFQCIHCSSLDVIVFPVKFIVCGCVSLQVCVVSASPVYSVYGQCSLLLYVCWMFVCVLCVWPHMHKESSLCISMFPCVAFVIDQ